MRVSFGRFNAFLYSNVIGMLILNMLGKTRLYFVVPSTFH